MYMTSFSLLKHSITTICMITSLWKNPHKNKLGRFDEHGNVFLVQERNIGNQSTFAFVPFLQKSSSLQKFSYLDDVILYDFYNPKSGKHHVDIMKDDGGYYRMNLNDTTLYHDVHKNIYRRYNHFGDGVFCDMNGNSCFQINATGNSSTFYQHMYCIDDVQFLVDSNNKLIIRQQFSTKDLYATETDIKVQDLHVEQGIFNGFYVFLKDEEKLHVYTFRYEANQVFFKMKSTVPLESCLDYYIAYPYVFVFVNQERVNIHRMDMLQSKFLLRPPKSLADENKIFYFQKRLFFFGEHKTKNLSFCCLQHLFS